MKKGISLLLLVCLVLTVFAGCQSDERSESNTGDPDFRKASEDFDSAVKNFKETQGRLSDKIAESEKFLLSTKPDDLADSNVLDKLRSEVDLGKKLIWDVPEKATDAARVNRQIQDISTKENELRTQYDTLCTAIEAVNSSKKALADRIAEESKFKPGNNFSYEPENNGYSAVVKVNTWRGQPGDNTAKSHPADSSVQIPAMPNSSCLIPVEVTFQITTPSQSFTTDLMYSLGGSGTMKVVGSVNVYIDNKWTVATPYSAFSGGGLSKVYRGLKRGQSGKILCYIEITNYYTPEFPDGSTSRLNPYGLGAPSLTVMTGFTDYFNLVRVLDLRSSEGTILVG